MTDQPGIIAAVPARFGSTRFPAKMLANLAGRPLIVRTLENLQRCRTIGRILVATDDERIAKVVRAAGGEAVMTSPNHPSGTDRIYEAIRGIPGGIVVNVQGDEPLLPPEVIDKTVRLLQAHREASAATAATALSVAEYTKPSVVKVVRAADGRALYFSRAPIPFERAGGFPAGLALRHIGLYAFRREALERFCSLPPSPLERCEMLEQLRLLEDGGTMLVHLAESAGPGGVDTTDDLLRVADAYARRD